MEVNELKEKIEVLEAKVQRLEKFENRRQTAKKIKIAVYSILVIAIVVLLIIGYFKVKSYIMPYKESFDEIKEKYDSVKETTSSFSLDKLFG